MGVFRGVKRECLLEVQEQRPPAAKWRVGAAGETHFASIGFQKAISEPSP